MGPWRRIRIERLTMSKYDVQALRNELEVIHQWFSDTETEAREYKQYVAKILLEMNCMDAIRELDQVG